MGMVNLHFRATELGEGYTRIVGPGDAGLRLLEFGRIILGREQVYRGETGEREAALDILTGSCTVEVECGETFLYRGIGGRKDVFSSNPTMLYIPRGSAYRVSAGVLGVDAAVFSAPSENGRRPLLIEPKDVAVASVGAWNWRRDVRTGIGSGVDVDRLIVGETVNPPGNWSSAPPHKHDRRSPPVEVPMEEIYFYRVKPPQGFGVQVVYTAPGDEEPFEAAYVVRSDDAVAIPRGYHPVAALPGYQLYYLWGLAGEERLYGAWSDDPAHSWLRSAEPIVKEASG